MQRSLCYSLLLATFFWISNSVFALSVVSGPTFTPATNAPLAGRLQLATDSASRVSVSVDDGTSVWTHDFYDFGTTHSVPLLGFKPGTTNVISISLYDQNQNLTAVEQTLTFVSPALPLDFPILTVLQDDPSRMEPGYTLFHIVLGNTNYQAIIDNTGQVVWYSPVNSFLEIRQLTNGDLFISSLTNFMELNMLGELVQSWVVPTNLLVNLHDQVLTDHGTILYMSDTSTVVSNYPTSTTVATAPRTTANNVIYQTVVELSATNGAVLNVWPLINLLEPNRITYLTSLGPPVWDSEHGNGLIEDPSDNSIIVSLRHQNVVLKFSRETGQLVWLLGPPQNWDAPWQPYLLTPVGAPFEWEYGQHTPVLTPQGTLMVYDDGNYRATPFDPPVGDATNYSRAVEYQIDPESMVVSQAWEYGSNAVDQLYTDKVGSAEPMPQTGNVLICFGSVKYVNGVPPSVYGPNATMARIQEVTHDANPEVLFDLAVTEYNNPHAATKALYVYRSYRIADLYAHPALPVADLTISYQTDTAQLQFSGDPTHTYMVEASTDLANWVELGVAAEEGQSGSFSFQEPAGSGNAFRYFRVVTY
ncbi:MAG TPA: aryl-sulfate sulfotransferase [Verrucomicrobiae bacterium]|nr:aryl-sulfate sulfotransferase [Verrucomicrobiae bacterium]